MPVRIAKPAVNIREKLAELERPIGLNGSALMRTETPQEAFSLIGAGRRNLIINGDMRISQRGTSFTNLAADQYTLDRFFMGSSTNAFTVSQGTSTLPSGKSVNIFNLTCNSNVSHWIDPYQGIEDFRSISGQTVTLSAWVRTNHPNVNFRQYATRNIGNTFIPDGQWRYYTATTTLGTISTLARGVNSPYFGITNSSTSSWTSGQYVQFTEFQIELGKVATPFEYRIPGEELAMCQRYYYRTQVYLQGYTAASQDYSVIYHHPVQMRASGVTATSLGDSYTVNVSNTIISGIPSIVSTSSSDKGLRIYVRATNLGYIEKGFDMEVSSEL